MRKNMRKVAAIFVCIILLFATTACKHEIGYDSPKGGTYKMTAFIMDDMAGTLNGTSVILASSEESVVVTKTDDNFLVTVNGVPETGVKLWMMELMYEDIPQMLQEMSLTFGLDNVLSAISSEGEINGSYSVDGDFVAITLNGSSQTGETRDRWQTVIIDTYDEGCMTVKWDSYRRYIQMFGNVVMSAYHDKLGDIIEEVKSHRGIKEDAELKPEELQEIVIKYKAMYKRIKGEDLPQYPQKMIMSRI